MSSITRVIGIILIAALVIAGLTGGVLLYRNYPKTLEECLPDQVSQLVLYKTTSGREAVEITKQSHRGEIRLVKDMTIGYYAEDLSIWLSEYPDEATAKKETERMVKAMPAFGQGFEALKQIKLGGEKAFETKPQGKPHYFWYKKNVLVYFIPNELSQKEVGEVAQEVNSKITLYSLLP